MEFVNELNNAILNEDFYETNRILNEIKQEENAFEYIVLLFDIMEKNPELDYGTPGPVVHFMEGFYKKGYEELLLNSIRKSPTSHTIWMLNRVINDPNLTDKEKYIDALKAFLNRVDITSTLQNEIQDFLRYQQNK